MNWYLLASSTSWRPSLLLITASIFYLLLISDVESLQCYNCRGVSYYDPDSCFHPIRGRTVRQECNRGEVCETRIHREENFDEIIERGCTNACAGRTYVWTDYFQVHCCDTNECNNAYVKKFSYPLLFTCLIYLALSLIN
ncbi:hypothetical protein LSH36_475g02087 [Paralvinella palmiformis]|uniref:Protein quiver n=1 Tax=Paralvinella palmiformis TaxID=53620 RepID=A0AAD9MYI5_9ANNE|nr:hypothetical protein LSH36_475g02087 [Paralvinella palmiformis]